VYRQADTDRERQVPYRTIQPNYTLQPPRRTLWGPADQRGNQTRLQGSSDSDTVDLGYAGSNTRRGRVGHDIAHTLETSCIQGIVERGGRIRRLMPRESLRLQGFAEEQIDKILAFTSDAQAYKQAGNSVTVTVIEAIGRRILAVDEEPRKMGDAA